ncbi:MAG TPA: carboxypeptidase regulatory-like domain-containing protein [Pyrinomonadaceae bacterium]
MNPVYNEFQRADCAPRVSLGNGALDVADFTQAGRYAAAVDAITPAGGQNTSSFAQILSETSAATGGQLKGERLRTEGESEAKNLSFSPSPSAFRLSSDLFVPTVVRVVNVDTSPGQQVFVTIATDAQGTENGFGFTLNYDSTKLSNPLVTRGTDAQTATLIPNASQAGKVGVVLAMPFNEAIQAGARQLVTIRFNVALNAAGGQTPLTFGDAPVIRAVSDVNANTLSSTFQDGAVNILAPTAASVSVSGRVLDANGAGISKARVSIIDRNAAERVALTNQFGYYQFEAIAVGAVYVVSAGHKNYQFTSRFITVLEETDGVNFIAQPFP